MHYSLSRVQTQLSQSYFDSSDVGVRSRFSDYDDRQDASRKSRCFGETLTPKPHVFTLLPAMVGQGVRSRRRKSSLDTAYAQVSICMLVCATAETLRKSDSSMNPYASDQSREACERILLIHRAECFSSSIKHSPAKTNFSVFRLTSGATILRAPQ
jgi:hypothetical protein